MQTGPEGAAIVRPAAQQHEPRILPARQCRHGRDGTRGLKDARSGQDHRAGSSVVQRCPQVCKSGAVFSAPEAFGQLGLTACSRQEMGGHVPQPRSTGMDDENLRAPARGLADAQMQDGQLVLGIEPHHDDHLGPFDIAVIDGRPPGHRCLSRNRIRTASGRAVVDVVRAEHGPGQLRERECVLVGEAPPGQDRDPPVATPPGDRGERFDEGHRLQSPLAQQRRGQAVRPVREREGEATLVAQPRVVHVEVVASEVADDIAPAKIDPKVAPARAVRADRVARLQIERAGGEPVRACGEGPHRADLDRVARERRTEVLARGDRDLFGGTPVEQLDETVAGYLVAEPSAPRAKHAPLPVERNQRGKRQRLAIGALGFDVAGLARAERQGLVLERTLPSPVAHRAVKRVVDQQELQDRRLGLLHLLVGELREDHHAVGHGGGT